MKSLLLTLLLAGSVWGVDIVPYNPQPYQLVQVKHGVGGHVEIFGILDGNFVLPDLYLDESKGVTLFAARPGKLLISGVDSDGRRIREQLEIPGSDDASPPIPPGPDDADTDDDVTPPSEDTEFGVGPAVRQAVPASKRTLLAGVFESAALDLRSSGRPVDQATKVLSRELAKHLNSDQYTKYRDAFNDAWKAGKLVDQDDFIGAFLEVAEWLKR